MKRPEVHLTARIFFTEGFWHCHIIEIGQVVQSTDRDQMPVQAWILATEYFEVKRARGRLKAELLRLGVDAASLDEPDHFPDIWMTIKIELDRTLPASPFPASVDGPLVIAAA